MAYGGLRGAVAFALVMVIDEHLIPTKKMMVTTVIALVYFLDKQAHQGSDAHLNKVPNQKIVFNTSTVKFDEQFKNIPGFYYSKNDTKNQNKHQKGNYDQGRMSGN